MTESRGRDQRFDVYWANGLFAEADRRFNADCAAEIRQRGYTVYLPQEFSANARDHSPSSHEVFRGDTEMLYRSRCLIACLDQESIDSGVAAEVGIAYSLGIPIVGLYTDIRQYRTGIGRMYKNLYVVGMVEAGGVLIDSLDNLLSVLSDVLDVSRSDGSGTQVAGSAESQRYRTFVRQLERWYRPSWNTVVGLAQWLDEAATGRVLEFGCGPGTVAERLVHQLPDAKYVGYDRSVAMVDEATRAVSGSGISFVSEWSQVVNQRGPGFDAAILSFVLHDVSDPMAVLSQVAGVVRRPGSILIADLATWDLPELVSELRTRLASPLSLPDPRLDPSRLASWGESIGATAVEQTIATPDVAFPTAKAAQDFVSVFGIDHGADLPLGIRSDGSDTQRLHRSLRLLTYPFADRRCFLLTRLGFE